MNRLKLLISHRRNDERGVTLIVVAICMSLLFPVALAFSVELGQDTVVNRSLQGAADAGALDAAQYLSTSTADVQGQGLAGVTDNYSGASSTITEGMWSGSSFTASSTCESSNSCNAVMATAGSSVKHLFEAGSSSLSRSAVAANLPAEAGFSIGTTLASFSTQESMLQPILNALAPGSGVTLSLASYDGLVGTSVSLLQLINASGGVLTPNNVLSTQITDKQLAQFIEAALAAQPTTTNITNALGYLTSVIPFTSTSTTLTLCQAISVNGSTCASPSVSTSALAASANVLQTLTYTAELANKTSGIDLTTGLNIPGVTDAKIDVTAIQPAQIAYGKPGISVSTAELTGTIVLTLAGLVTLTIPLTSASGTATLNKITCSSGVVSGVNIAPISTNTINNTSISVGLAAIPVATVPLNISGATLPSGFTFAPTFGPSDAPDNSNWECDSRSWVIAGLSLLNGAVALIVNPVLGLLSPVLVPLLQVLGVSVATATVGVSSATCGGAQLVQ